jgi:hypothetical protein
MDDHIEKWREAGYNIVSGQEIFMEKQTFAEAS